MDSVFVPGWGAPASLYRPLLPAGWSALEPRPFASLDEHVLALLRELSRRGRSVVGGHSMGGAVALLAAARAPELVERLVLVSPAGLPIVKPMRRSLRDFASQVGGGLYPLRTAVAGTARLAATPRSALRLARQVRVLDLRVTCARIRASAVPAVVAGCPGDTLIRCESARLLAAELGADYVEVGAGGGHMWMLAAPTEFATLLAR